MTEISMQEALIAKLYNGVLEIADWTCSTLIKKSVVELAENNPSFGEVSNACQSIISVIKEHSDTDKRIEQVEELVEILDHIVVAIPNNDNSTLVDCTCHLEQYLEINVRTSDSKLFDFLS